MDDRIVGGWAHAPDGAVVPVLLEEVPGAVREAIIAEANTLASWLDGVAAVRVSMPITRLVTT